jgi:hypothetical protein
MDPAIQQLATQVMTILLPYVTIGAGEIAKSVGKDAYEKAKSLFSTLREWWKGDKEAEDSLVRFEEKPERYQGILEDILKEKLATDPGLATRVSEIVQEVGPALSVFQKIIEGKHIGGLVVENFRSGSAEVKQDIEKG